MLDAKDKQILRVLCKKPLHPSALAQKIKLPRTTISYRLQRLKRHGFVKNNIKGKKVIWNYEFNPVHIDTPIAIHSGASFQDAYLEILQLPRKSIAYSIQGKEAGRNELRNLPRSLIEEIHKVWKKNNIVFLSISNKKILELVNKLDTAFIESHFGRGGGLKLVQDNTFLDAGELFVSKQFVLISNPKDKIAVTIKEPAIVSMFFEMFILLFDNLHDYKSFDMNEFLGKCLDKKTLQNV